MSLCDEDRTLNLFTRTAKHVSLSSYHLRHGRVEKKSLKAAGESYDTLNTLLQHR